jgi:hypothetical protein
LTIREGKTQKGTNFRRYQIMEETQNGQVIVLNVSDFDLNRKVESDKVVSMQVFVTSYISKSDGKSYIQYHAINSTKTEETATKQDAIKY